MDELARNRFLGISGGDKAFEEFFGGEAADIEDGLKDGHVFLQLAACFSDFCEIYLTFLLIALQENVAYLLPDRA